MTATAAHARIALRLRRLIAAAESVLAAASILAACSSAPRPVATQSTATALGPDVFASIARAPVPDIRANTLSGKRIALRSLVGHGVLVLNVWASWCTECRSESPALATLARQLQGQGVSFVGLDEQDSVSKARSFARATGMSYPHLIDPDGNLLSKLKVLPSYGIPSSLFINSRGDMAGRIVGAATAAQVRALIARIR